MRSGGLDTKTILEIHQVLRRSLDDAVRRGLIVSNPAQVAHAPRRRPLGSTVARAWNAQQLREFLDHVGDHPFFAALWGVGQHLPPQRGARRPLELLPDSTR